MLKKGHFAIIFLAVLLSACAPVVSPAQTTIATAEEPAETTTEEATATFEPVNLKVGLQPYSSNLPVYLAQAEGFYAEQGLNVEFVPFTSAQDATVALIQGDIDVFGTSLIVSPLTAIAEGVGIKFVADKGFLDPNGCPYAAWVARTGLLESGQLDELSNIANLKVLVGPATDYALDVLLESVGLTTTDLNGVDIPSQNLLDGFQNGALDVALVGEPGLTRLLNAGVAEIWKPWQEYMPGGQLALLWYGPTITEQNREAGNRFMVAYRKGVEQYNEGKTDRNVELMAEFTQLDPVEVRQICWQSFTPDGSINFDTLMDFQEWAVAKGLLDAVVPMESFWDGSFLEYANSHLE